LEFGAVVGSLVLERKVLMNPLEKVSRAEDVPVLTRAWEHSGEILGVTPDGELVIVARLVTAEGEEPRATSGSKQRKPRKKPSARQRLSPPELPSEETEESAESEEG